MRWPWTRLSALLAALLAPAVAVARAGGGEHYTGGGGSSDDGGGGIPIELIWLLLRLTFEYPHIGIPIWILVGFVVWQLKRSTPASRTSRAMHRLDEVRVRPQPDLHSALQHLRERDPSFDPDALAARVRKVFAEIQEAWFRRDLKDVRRHMSDGLHRRFTTLLDLMAAEGRRDALADLNVLAVRLLRTGKSDAFDAVTFAVDAEVRDTDVPAKDSDDEARRKASHAPRERFSEIWTFVRRLGAKTREGFDLGQGNCPNCGAPFHGGAANKCEYCGAIVNSGHHDWVLSEITQPEEYLPHAASGAVLGPLRERDPGVSAEVLEDRALLLFWKWIEAFSLVRRDVLRKLATTSAFDRITDELARAPTAGVPLLRVPAVGGADVVAVEADAEGLDRVHVDVRWSASTGAAGPRPRRHVVTMVRRTGAKTGEAGLSTERCGTCMAPLTDSDSTRCDYCGHDLSSAGTEWQLEAVAAYESWHRPASAPANGPPPLPSFATRGERLRLLQLMAAIARADGEVDRSEEKLLRAYAKRWDVAWDDVAPLLHDHEDQVLAGLGSLPADRAEQFLATLVAAAKVDGRIDARERRLIRRAAQHLHAPEATVERLLH